MPYIQNEEINNTRRGEYIQPSPNDNVYKAPYNQNPTPYVYATNKFNKPIENSIKKSEQLFKLASDLGIDYSVANRLRYKLLPVTTLDADYQNKVDEVNSNTNPDYHTSTHFPKGTWIVDNYLILTADVIYDETTVINNYSQYKNTIYLDCFFVSVDRQKRIVKTEIPGLDSSIKELIGLSDWTININGSFIGPNPYERDELNIERLRQLSSLNQSLTLINPLLNTRLKIDQVVIDKIDINNDQKYSNVNTYSITLISDQSVNFINYINDIKKTYSL